MIMCRVHCIALPHFADLYGIFQPNWTSVRRPSVTRHQVISLEEDAFFLGTFFTT